MAADHTACTTAREALALGQDLHVRMTILQRHVDVIETDKIRLGDRVTATEQRAVEHESETNRAVKRMHDMLADLNTSVRDLQGDVKNAVSAPPVPTGAAVLHSWQQTSVKTRAKIGGAIVGLLIAPEFLKQLLTMAFTLLKRLLNVP